MHEAFGNLWEFPQPVKVITTNGHIKSNGAVVMGRGCAKEARDRWPGIDKRLGELVKVHGNRVFRLILDRETAETIVSFPVKHHWKEAADLDLIVTSTVQLVKLADDFNLTEIVMPRPGCGNGHLEWENVKPTLSYRLDDRFTVVTWKESE